MNAQIKSIIPFAVVGSEHTMNIDGYVIPSIGRLSAMLTLQLAAMFPPARTVGAPSTSRTRGTANLSTSVTSLPAPTFRT